MVMDIIFLKVCTTGYLIFNFEIILPIDGVSFSAPIQKTRLHML